jgi:putative effector of murein hydrolase LrgA (UPF0299 family)
MSLYKVQMIRKLLFIISALIFVPFGFMVIKSAFYLNSPHIFAMFLFSGSLMILLGLTGLVGLIVDLAKKSQKKHE